MNILVVPAAILCAVVGFVVSNAASVSILTMVFMGLYLSKQHAAWPMLPCHHDCVGVFEWVVW